MKKAIIWPTGHEYEDEKERYHIAPIEDIEEKIDLYGLHIYKFPKIKTEAELLELIPDLKNFDDSDELRGFMDDAGIEYEMAADDETPEDIICYDYHLKEIFNLGDCDTTLVYEYWDGSNTKQIWLDDANPAQEITYAEEPVDIDTWDGSNFYYRHKFNHGLIYKLIENDGEKADSDEYILYEYTQYQEDIPVITFISAEEAEKLIREAE